MVRKKTISFVKTISATSEHILDKNIDAMNEAMNADLIDIKFAISGSSHYHAMLCFHSFEDLK